MNDLISRKLAIEALGEEPMVWNDDDAFALGERNQWRCNVEAIKGVPSAESEIVRCKDCRNYAPYWGNCRHWERISTESVLVAENDFCSQAERRESR